MKEQQKAGLKKLVYPHLFRHTVATMLSKKWPPHMISQYLGWELGSEMPSIYIHLSGKDLDRVIYKLQGLEVEEEEEEKGVLKCRRCGKVVPKEFRFCPHCGTLLRLEDVAKIEEARKLAGEFFLSSEFEELRKEFYEWVKSRKVGR